MTTYNDKRTGEEIFAPKRIALHYMFNGSFIIDFLSTFPFGDIGEAAGVPQTSMFYLFANCMSLLKVQRLKKILKKIRDMDITIEDKSML